MNMRAVRTGALAAGLIQAAMGLAAHGAIIISEVHPSGSGNAPYQADFFELTNTGSTAVNITGWKIDDNSNSAGSSVSLRGVTSIPAGASVIFFEGLANASTDTTISANFISAWFGGTAPAGFLIGSYGGSGVGLSTGGDAVNIFDASNVLITRVDFGASTANVTFDNAAGLSNVTLTQLSVVGVNGAILSTGSPREIGSPGAIPAPASAGVLALGALTAGRRARRA